MKYTVYCDGACKSNPVGDGGWGAVVIQYNDNGEYIKETHLNGGPFERTSNNRMEMTAALEGIKFVEPGSQILLCSDSKYVIESLKGNWRRMKNLDIWSLLDKEISTRLVSFMWVKGHNGDLYNEVADQLATAGVKGQLV